MVDVIHKGFFIALSKGLLETTPDVRGAVVMPNTTLDTEEDAVFVADVTTIDEFDGVGYAPIDFANVSLAFDDATDELRLYADSDTFGDPVAPGSGVAQGLYIWLYIDGTGDNDYVLGYTEAGGFGVNAANGAMTLTIPAEGLIFGKQAA